jgi:hypothetical protein
MQVLAISGLWNTAMAYPNDPEFVELGVFECMAQLIWKGIRNQQWLAQDQNIYIPYYAAHIIGSYTMNREEFAEEAVRAGSISHIERKKVSILGFLLVFGCDHFFFLSADMMFLCCICVLLKKGCFCIQVSYLH